MEFKKNPPPCYFYPPKWTFSPPPEGPIRLGNVLKDFTEPQYSILPRNSLVEISPEDGVQVNTKSKCEHFNKTAREGSFSLWANFLGVAKSNLSPGRTKMMEQSFIIEGVETSEFTPTDAYIARCVSAEAVSNWLKRNRYRKPIYLVTGIKMTRGSTKAYFRQGSFRGVDVGSGADANVLSGGIVPVGAGAEVSRRYLNEEGFSWEGDSDFVLGYEVRRVTVKKDDTFDHDKHINGAVLGTEGEDESPPMRIVSTEAYDFVSEDDNLEMKEYMEDGIPVLFASPK